MPMTLALCGDVMTGRGVDQILPHPGDARIPEPSGSAEVYVDLARRAHGPIPRPVAFSYVWGDALAQLATADARIVNLETAVTRSDDYWPDKAVNYRMHPANVACITAAGIDCCVLANNHVIDYGYAGLVETLDTLRAAGVKTAGAGRDLTEARAPAVIELGGQGQVLVFGFGTETSGIPPAWAATASRPGITLLRDLSDETVDWIGRAVRRIKQPRDVVVASIHWGGNWGFGVPAAHVRFAHGLVERAGVDLVHGHSSHHVRPIEVFSGKLILYGCGDFLDDYEGIRGHERFRNELTLLYLPSVDPVTGRLTALQMTALRIEKFMLNRASPDETRWLADTLDRESRRFGFRTAATDVEGRLRWAGVDGGA